MTMEQMITSLVLTWVVMMVATGVGVYIMAK